MTRISNGENASAVFDLGLMQIQISANTAAERNMQTGVQPTSLTILPTYKCNASCRDCCFQSNPRLSTRLSGKAILDRINEAKAKFPSIRQIIFSGGEALLLKGDLHDAVRLASELGLGTRLVSNGFWGKRQQTSEAFARDLRTSGLKELNLSTGLDHQEFVPEESIVQAAAAAISQRITTLITVEVDSAASKCLESLLAHPSIHTLNNTGLLRIISNSWMPCDSSESARHAPNSGTQLRKGCSQIFNNITIKPNDRLSACCGLTLERIPELDLGANSGNNMRELYDTQQDDLMKIWLHLDGPHQIISASTPGHLQSKLDDVVHICQACTLLHRDPEIAAYAQAAAVRMMPDLITRFTIRVEADKHLKRGVTHVQP
jgi:hypothetical protein